MSANRHKEKPSKSPAKRIRPDGNARIVG